MGKLSKLEQASSLPETLSNILFHMVIINYITIGLANFRIFLQSFLCVLQSTKWYTVWQYSFTGFPWHTNIVMAILFLWVDSLCFLQLINVPELSSEGVQIVRVIRKNGKVWLVSSCLFLGVTNVDPSLLVNLGLGSPGCPLTSYSEYSKFDWSTPISRSTMGLGSTDGKSISFKCGHLNLYIFQSTTSVLPVTRSVV